MFVLENSESTEFVPEEELLVLLLVEPVEPGAGAAADDVLEYQASTAL